MQCLENFYLKTLKYDFTNKYMLNNTKDIPKLKKIILNFNCWSKPFNLKQLASSMLALELITSQKGILTKTNFSNLSIRLKKGTPIGCKLTLKKDCNYVFLSKIIQETSPSSKTFRLFKSNKIKNAFSFDIVELFSFTDLEKQYHIFTGLTSLNITLIFNSNSLIELEFLLKSLQITLKS